MSCTDEIYFNMVAAFTGLKSTGLHYIPRVNDGGASASRRV